MIKLILLMALFVSCFSCYFIPVSAAQKGECGEDLSWTLNAGTLTIKGEGAMTDYSELNLPPWYEFRDEIIRVVFPEGLTTIGNMAFYNCSNLINAVIPDKVTKIGHYSFANCETLNILSIGSRVSKIGRSAFYGCKSITSLTLPYSIQTIDEKAFYLCTSLSYVFVPENLNSMGSSVFSYCENLIFVEIGAYITTIPGWSFYGCENLSAIIIPESVTSFEDNSFWGCENLISVYVPGNGENNNIIENHVASESENFRKYGTVSNNDPPESVLSNEFYEDADVVISKNTMFKNGKVGTTIIVTTEQERKPQNPEATPTPTPSPSPEAGATTKPSATSAPQINRVGTYDTEIFITITDEDSWEVAEEEVEKALKYVKDTYDLISTSKDTTITVKVMDGALDTDFLTGLTAKEVTLNVVNSDGSEWKIDCSELKANSVNHDTNYSYTVTEGSKDNAKELGTDNCYQLSFNEDAKINAQIVVKVPAKNTANSNAFLYQVEEDGSYTRLQAVRVGSDGNVNLYLGAVDDKTEYVIGIDVPDEKTDDVIIPDELAAEYNNAIERLEKIEYVITGVNSSWGMGMGRVTVILICVLVGCAVVVGVAMGIMNKRKLKKMYSNNAKV